MLTFCALPSEQEGFDITFSRSIIAIATLLCSLATRAEANRFADNPEFVIDRLREPWTGPIGELAALTPKVTKTLKGYKEDLSVGTGFLVSPCYVLTAAHVVYQHDLTPVPGTDYRMKFRAGTSTTAAFAGNTTATPVAAGYRDESHRNDWALLRLNYCVGQRPEIGWLETNAPPLFGAIENHVPTDARALAMGYDSDRERGTLTGGSGKILGVDPRNGLLTFDGSFAPGASGGPVMIDRDGVLTVVALNIAGMGDIDGATSPSLTTDRANFDRANLIQSVFEIVNRPDIKPILELDKALSGMPNPNLMRLQMKNIPQFASRPRLLRLGKQR